jgi:hypothetical protein
MPKSQVANIHNGIRMWRRVELYGISRGSVIPVTFAGNRNHGSRRLGRQQLASGARPATSHSTIGSPNRPHDVRRRVTAQQWEGGNGQESVRKIESGSAKSRYWFVLFSSLELVVRIVIDRTRRTPISAV